MRFPIPPSIATTPTSCRWLAVAALAAVLVAVPAAAQTPPPAAAKPAAPVATPAAAVPLPYQSADTSMGVVNCANSVCHGSVQPIKDSDVLQTEYVTWSRVDKHSRAYKVLSSEQSQRIARNLGLAKPANQEKICLDCHAHNVPVALRGERFKFDDGVSCEACHGPSGRWLQSHDEQGATHAGNLKAGLFPTDDPVARAQLCLSCHFGNSDRFVTHRIMGAGHPRMSFELDTFTAVEPAHFKPDSDWEKRKRMWDGVKVWAIGQALIVREMTDVLVDPKRGRDGLFPELVLFDCYACHHPMSDKRWVPRVAGLGPGTVRLNDSSMLMVRQIAHVVDPPLGDRIAATMTRLQQTVTGGGDAMGQAKALGADMTELIAVLDKRDIGPNDMRAILAGLINDGLRGQYRDYAGAEQATMAIGSVSNFMYQRGVLKSARDVNVSLAALQAAVGNDERYSPAQFEAALRQFRGTVGL
jgi:hypothetical protein